MLAGETQERIEEIWNAVTSEITRYANDSTASVSLDNKTICAASSPRVKSKRKGISPMTLNFNQFIHGYACGHIAMNIENMISPTSVASY